MRPVQGRLPRILSAVAVSMFAVVAALGATTPALAEDIFYDISRDPDSLKLLALSTIEGGGSRTTMMMVDVYKAPQAALISTWRIDCEKETMGIFQARQLMPTGPGEWTNVKFEPFGARSSPQSWESFKLACTGAGDLEERRVYRGELAPTLERFWGR